MDAEQNDNKQQINSRIEQSNQYITKQQSDNEIVIASQRQSGDAILDMQQNSVSKQKSKTEQQSDESKKEMSVHFNKEIGDSGELQLVKQQLAKSKRLEDKQQYWLAEQLIYNDVNTLRDGNNDNIEDQFTTLDVLNDIYFIRPIYLILRKTRFVRNDVLFNHLKYDLLKKLQIQKIVKKLNRINDISERMTFMEKKSQQLLQMFESDSSESSSKQSVNSNDQFIDENDFKKVSNQQNVGKTNSLSVHNKNRRSSLKSVSHDLDDSQESVRSQRLRSINDIKLNKTKGY